MTHGRNRVRPRLLRFHNLHRPLDCSLSVFAHLGHLLFKKTTQCLLGLLRIDGGRHDRNRPQKLYTLLLPPRNNRQALLEALVREVAPVDQAEVNPGQANRRAYNPRMLSSFFRYSVSAWLNQTAR